MRLGTANIKNYPDMPKNKVVLDGKTMSRLTDLWCHQENDPDEDYPAIMKGLDDDWAGVHGDTNVPIYYKQSVFNLIGKRKVIVPLEPDLPLVAKPRVISAAGFKLDKRPDLPPFIVMNCHFIAGGYNGPTEVKRASQWNVEFQHLQNFVRDYKHKGRSVFVLGDFNHPRPPKPVRNFQWLVGEHLDKIGVSTTGPMEVSELNDGAVELNSDHWGQWSRCVLQATA